MTVVTRFAPSPTGYLHIGGARTALFCWLYARHAGGKFLLRIEDTDRERSTQAAVDALLDGLGWLGLSGDEPPVYQSQRAARHAEVANELVKRGAAYRAYETVEELDADRNARAARAQLHNARLLYLLDTMEKLTRKKEAPLDQVLLADLRAFPDPVSPLGAPTSESELLQWANNERKQVLETLDPLTRAFRSPYRDGTKSPPSQDAPFVVRLRMPDTETLEVNDKVQGLTRLAVKDLDDFILLRSDGTPTYMLAVVVDDHDMGVTHVIRGDDHFINTFRQAPIFQGMNWAIPSYAHVPLIHDPGGKKLSKREGAAAVEEYRDEFGYLPEAMRNYLLRLGWSHGDDEIISDAQAIQWFDLSGLNKAPARLDFPKLDFVNKHYMAQADDQRLFDLFLKRPEAKGLSQEVLGRIRSAMPALKTRSPNLVALAEQARFLTDIRPIALTGKQADQVNDEARERLAGLVPRLEKLADWTEPAIKKELADFTAQLGIGMGKIGPVLRAVLTGGASAPDITLVLALLGRNESVARMRDHVRIGG